MSVVVITEQIMERTTHVLAENGGAALFIDYGEDFAQADTLRGLQRHAMVSWLAEPGEVDLSCDVDFAQLKEVVKKSGSARGVLAHGPVTQGEFLSAMGIEVRLGALLDSPSITDKQAMLLYDSYRRLTDPEQMGRKYKALAVVGKSHQGPAVGF